MKKLRKYVKPQIKKRKIKVDALIYHDEMLEGMEKIFLSAKTFTG